MISKDVIRHVAELARLEFSEEELDTFVGEFRKIVAYVDHLRALDAGKVDACQSPVAEKSRLREDRAKPWEGVNDAAGNAPEWMDGHFVVPRVVDKRDPHESP